AHGAIVRPRGRRGSARPAAEHRVVVAVVGVGVLLAPGGHGPGLAVHLAGLVGVGGRCGAVGDRQHVVEGLARGARVPLAGDGVGVRVEGVRRPGVLRAHRAQLLDHRVVLVAAADDVEVAGDVDRLVAGDLLLGQHGGDPVQLRPAHVHVQVARAAVVGGLQVGADYVQRAGRGVQLDVGEALAGEPVAAAGVGEDVLLGADDGPPAQHGHPAVLGGPAAVAGGGVPPGGGA